MSIEAADLRVLNMRTRMPFRYGIASLEALPHLFVRVRARIDGTGAIEAEGVGWEREKRKAADGSGRLAGG